MVFSNFNRRLYDNICKYNFSSIYAKNILLLFLELLGSKGRKMLHSSSKKQRSHSIEIVVSTTLSTSNFKMIRKYDTSNKYDFLRDWYVQIDTLPNMYTNMYLFGSTGGENSYILVIVVNCYADG